MYHTCNVKYPKVFRLGKGSCEAIDGAKLDIAWHRLKIRTFQVKIIWLNHIGCMGSRLHLLSGCMMNNLRLQKAFSLYHVKFFRSKGCLCRRCRWWKDFQKSQNWKTHHHSGTKCLCFLPIGVAKKGSGCFGSIARHSEEKLARLGGDTGWIASKLRHPFATEICIQVPGSRLGVCMLKKPMS